MEFSSTDYYDIIKNYFKDQDNKNYIPNYYQFRAFVNILSELLKLFSGDFYLYPEILSQEGQFRDRLKCRKLLIKRLIELAKICTMSAYKKISEGQQFAYNQIHNIYNADFAQNKAIDFLATQERITFDKLPGGGIAFINKDGHSLSVVTNTNKLLQKDKIILTTLWNSQNFEGNTNSLIDYQNLSSEEYIEQIKLYFNLNKQPSIPEGYVFTADNFFKMILIDIKTNSYVPVVLMGETGCGKTFLIRMICQVYNIKLEIKNIHAGITEKDIIDFMNKVIELNNNPNTKIWVFFDEINTSNAIGLISEIMCNRTMKGKKLPNNLVFIGACNPYRKKAEVKSINYGLVYKKFKNRDLVYNVVPLPHSIINFVFDFGNLCEKDEKRYIGSMVKQVKINNPKLEIYAI